MEQMISSLEPELQKEFLDITKWYGEEEGRIIAELKAQGRFKVQLDGEPEELIELNKEALRRCRAAYEKYGHEWQDDSGK